MHRFPMVVYRWRGTGYECSAEDSPRSQAPQETWCQSDYGSESQYEVLNMSRWTRPPRSWHTQYHPEPMAKQFPEVLDARDMGGRQTVGCIRYSTGSGKTNEKMNDAVVDAERGQWKSHSANLRLRHRSAQIVQRATLPLSSLATDPYTALASSSRILG